MQRRVWPAPPKLSCYALWSGSIRIGGVHGYRRSRERLRKEHWVGAGANTLMGFPHVAAMVVLGKVYGAHGRNRNVAATAALCEPTKSRWRRSADLRTGFPGLHVHIIRAPSNRWKYRWRGRIGRVDRIIAGPLRAPRAHGGVVQPRDSVGGKIYMVGGFGGGLLASPRRELDFRTGAGQSGPYTCRHFRGPPPGSAGRGDDHLPNALASTTAPSAVRQDRESGLLLQTQ
jgi:hypothetical protein